MPRNQYFKRERQRPRAQPGARLPDLRGQAGALGKKGGDPVRRMPDTLTDDEVSEGHRRVLDRVVTALGVEPRA